MIGLVVVTAVVLAIAFMAKRREPVSSVASETAPATPAASAVDAGRTAAVETTAFKPVVVASEIQPVPPGTINSVPVPELSDEERQGKIAEAVTQINAALMQNDSNSVALIMSSLTNAEKEVREQAVSAVKQLGDRDLIPALTNLAARTENYEDRHAIQEAADFIALPTMTEAEKYWKESGTLLPASPIRRDGSQGSRHTPPGQRRGNQQPATPGGAGVPNQ